LNESFEKQAESSETTEAVRWPAAALLSLEVTVAVNSDSALS
jgi:hypothetical protein